MTSSTATRGAVGQTPARPVTAAIGAEGYAVAIEVGPFSLRADEPLERQGADTGPTPHQLVAAGLASCTAMTLRMYADRHAWPLTAARVEVRERRTEDPDRGPVAFNVSVALEGPLEPAAHEALMSVAARCPVHQTLQKGAEITLVADRFREHDAPDLRSDGDQVVRDA